MKRFATILWAHTKANLTELLRYPLEFGTMYLIIILFLGGIFLGINAFVPAGRFLGDTRTAIFIGYMLWTFYMLTVQGATFAIIRGAREGYLERELASTYSHTTVIITKILASTLSRLIHYLLIAVVCILLFGIDVHLDAASLLVIFPLVYLFLLGLGLIFAGLSLALKRVRSLVGIIQMAIMLISFGALGSYGAFGEAVFRWIPYTQGIRLLRDVLVDGAGFAHVARPGNLLPLVVGAMVFFALGLVVFRALDRLAMRRGLIGQF